MMDRRFLQLHAQQLLYLSPSLTYKPLSILSSPLCDEFSGHVLHRAPYLGRRLLRHHVELGRSVAPSQMLRELQAAARHCELPSARSPHTEHLRSIIERTGETDNYVIDALIAAGIWHSCPDQVIKAYLADRFPGAHFDYVSEAFYAEAVVAKSKIVDMV